MKFKAIGKDINTGNYNIIFTEDDGIGFIKIINITEDDLNHMTSAIKTLFN